MISLFSVHLWNVLIGVLRRLMQVAWLYNIRGTDVAYCPVVHAFAILTTDSAFLYVDKKKVSDEVWLLFLFSENMQNCAITSEFSMF